MVDSFTATEWVNLGRTPGTRRNRAGTLSQFCVANGFDGTVSDGLKIVGAENLIEAVRSGSLSPYSVANSFGQKLLSDNKAPGTVHSRLQVVRQFFLAMDIPVKVDLWRNRVVQVQRTVLRKKETITREQIAKTLQVAPPKTKAEIAFLISTGWRPDEMCRVRLEDINWEKKPVQVYLWAIDPVTGKSNKTGQPRTSFLTGEAVSLIRDYLAVRKDENTEYLFGGTSRRAVYANLHYAFKLAGIAKQTTLSTGKHVWNFSPYVFRRTNLAISKSAGYPYDWSELLAGHKVGTQAHYFDPEGEAGKMWVERVEPKLTFLTSTEELVKLEGTVKALTAEGENKKSDIERLRRDFEELKKLALRTEKAPSLEQAKSETLTRLQETAKRLMETGATKRFSNHVYDYIKCRMDSPDFDQALVEGYEVVIQSPDGLVLLRKPKESRGIAK